MLFLLFSVERYSAVWMGTQVSRRQGYSCHEIRDCVFWDDLTECTSDGGTSSQGYVVHNCQDILPGLFSRPFLSLLRVFSLHNIITVVYFSHSVLSSYTFLPKVPSFSFMHFNHNF